MFLDDSARTVRRVSGRRLPGVLWSAAEDHRAVAGALSFTTMPIAFMDYRVTQSMVPQELQNRATYILVKLSRGPTPSGSVP